MKRDLDQLLPLSGMEPEPLPLGFASHVVRKAKAAHRQLQTWYRAAIIATTLAILVAIGIGVATQAQGQSSRPGLHMFHPHNSTIGLAP